MAGATRITLPAPSRPTGGLLSAARPLEGEWWRGVTFSSTQCTVPQVVGTVCDETPPEKVPQRPGTPATFETFAVVASIDCTTMGRSEVGSLAEQTLDATREFAVGREFLSGASSVVSPSLADATELIAPDALSFRHRLGCLDQWAADALSGRLAFIHIPVTLATVYMSAGAIRLDGRTWRTAYGSVVVVSPGYDGRSAGGTAPVEGENLFIYATGEVYAAVGNRETLDAVDRSVNTRIAHSEEIALVAFDPCFSVAMDSGVAACGLTEGS